MSLESWKFCIFKKNKRYLLCHLSWELTTDHLFLNYGTISEFDWVGFLIFVLVSVSRDRNLSCKESTVGPARANVFSVFINVIGLMCNIEHEYQVLCKLSNRHQIVDD